MKNFVELVGQYYDKLYNGEIKSDKPYSSAGDAILETLNALHPGFLRSFIQTRGDALTSDREVDAFALAVVDILVNSVTMEG